ncbi:MAG: 50S ribosomal protein L11 methyltransferase [Pseudomonadota bacterium]|nr:50S ribosomal protein L11 methyltransferase [Rubrivivax sp.]MCA3259728.1 50S ribosomal protein L11 methyltransferase [Rubrivivax sp.]MCZ8032235.1 50S ribosomal protein L11 methyltransferase [Rubrivivax sp.]
MFELVLRAPEAVAEPLSDALLDDLGALAVTVEDADAGAAGERALYGEPGLPAPAAAWQRSTLKALFDGDDAAERAATLVLAQPWAAEVHVQSLAPVPDADWVRLTQAQFEPLAVTPSFWIVPSWHEAPAAAREVIRLDPGLAFGTGSHPTTQMVLRWIAANEAALRGARVLDYGCGSGILAIAAARFGAAEVVAVDIDPAAVCATADNARRNGVGLQAGLPETAHGGFDVVLANILARPLELLAPLLNGHLNAGGRLVLSGILERQAPTLAAAYAPLLAIDVLERLDGWVLMGGRRTP